MDQGLGHPRVCRRSKAHFLTPKSVLQSNCLLSHCSGPRNRLRTVPSACLVPLPLSPFLTDKEYSFPLRKLAKVSRRWPHPGREQCTEDPHLIYTWQISPLSILNVPTFPALLLHISVRRKETKHPGFLLQKVHSE